MWGILFTGQERLLPAQYRERDKELFRGKTIEEEAFFAETAICFQLLQRSTIEYFDSRVAAAVNLLIMDQKCHQHMMHNMLLA